MVVFYTRRKNVYIYRMYFFVSERGEDRGRKKKLKVKPKKAGWQQ